MRSLGRRFSEPSNPTWGSYAVAAERKPLERVARPLAAAD